MIYHVEIALLEISPSDAPHFRAFSKWAEQANQSATRGPAPRGMYHRKC
jgi:hypothetical protein